MLGNSEVAVALLDGGADIDFVTLRMPRDEWKEVHGCTPLMHAVLASNAGVAKLLLERGADGTKGTTQTVQRRGTQPGLDAGSTALDIARLFTTGNPRCAETFDTFAVLITRCCSTCGVTSAGLSAKTAGGEPVRLKQCSRCPAGGPRAHYCGTECQRADWLSRNRRECPR